ncbi:MAG: bifunctional 4-hydroxy-2-oxoglutarate aldolase/2-dehydro-3-deoxy-phosphogluconate aldolase [Thermoanaerobaculia bacterium]|nr:bifunctional 4-hydroxy-2-oxoglutarate aldolase/2-dehydro-3-deoxy-phosphogluconate aldolase [Thermoanaerobaculia bacterium]
MRTKQEVLDSIIAEGIIGVVRFERAELAAGTAEAYAEHGIRNIEITMTTPGALDLISDLAHRLGDRGITVAAGSVRGGEEARLAHEGGAEVLVSPHTDPAVIEYANDHDLVCVAGASTPTEIVRAWELGASIIKVYPARLLGGADYIRTIRQPIRGVRMLAGGPVDVEELPDYFDAGVVAVNMGGALAPLSFVEQHRWDEVGQRVRHALEAMSNWKNSRVVADR